MRLVNEKSVIAGTALAVSLGITTSAEAPPKGIGVASGDKKLIGEAFRDIKAYWRSQNIGSSAVKLVVVGEGEVVICQEDGPDGYISLTGESSSPNYCRSNKTIVFTKGYIDLIRRAHLDLKPVAIYVVGHEYGHTVQDARGMLDGRTSLVLEREADCLAGQAMRQTYTGQTKAVTDFLAKLDAISGYTSPTHGFGADRSRFFLNGIQGRPC